ncbi:unnamed protein product, partial [Mesorhabditis spiculigera]
MPQRFKNAAGLRLCLPILGFLIALAYSQTSAPIFSEEEQTKIVRLHNDLRAKVAQGEFVNKHGKRFPMSSNINLLDWSPTLADQAQKHTDKCGSQYTLNEDYLYGENQFMVAGSEQQIINATKAIETWADELYQIKWYNAPMFDMGIAIENIKNATQMIWWNLKLVGCGGTLCNGGTRVIFVCRYSETGLIIGNNSYPTGPPLLGLWSCAEVAV